MYSTEINKDPVEPFSGNCLVDTCYSRLPVTGYPIKDKRISLAVYSNLDPAWQSRTFCLERDPPFKNGNSNKKRKSYGFLIRSDQNIRLRLQQEKIGSTVQELTT